MRKDRKVRQRLPAGGHGADPQARYRGDQLPRFCRMAPEWAPAMSFGCRQMLRVSSDELKRIWNLAPSGLTGTAKSTRYVRLLPAGYAVSSEMPMDARTGVFWP